MPVPGFIIRHLALQHPPFQGTGRGQGSQAHLGLSLRQAQLLLLLQRVQEGLGLGPDREGGRLAAGQKLAVRHLRRGHCTRRPTIQPRVFATKSPMVCGDPPC